MTESADPLEGFRGDLPLSPEMEEASEKLKERLGEDAHLVEMFMFGEEMLRFQETKIGKHMVEKANAQLSEATRRMFNETDVTSDAFKKAHFEGTVALALLRLMDNAISSGKKAAEIIQSHDSLPED